VTFVPIISGLIGSTTCPKRTKGRSGINTITMSPRLIFAVFGQRVISPLHSFIKYKVYSFKDNNNNKTRMKRFPETTPGFRSWTPLED